MKRRTMAWLIAGLILSLGSYGEAWAQQGGGPGGWQRHRGPGRLFDFLDKNKDGKIDAQEAAQLPPRMQQVGTKLDIMQADANSDGFVDRPEFQAWAPQGLRPQGGPGGRGPGGPGGPHGGFRPGPMFNRLDTNQDGYLDATEIQQVQDPTRRQQLQAADTDGDGKVSRDELRAAVRQHLQQNPPQGGLRGAWKKVKNAAQTIKGVRQAYLNADKDGDKKLSAAEWSAAGAKTAFADVDEDQDGSVTRREVLRWMRKNPGQNPF